MPNRTIQRHLLLSLPQRLLGACALGLFSVSPLVAVTAVDYAVYDMTYNAEGTVHGLPQSSGWRDKGRINHWTPPSGTNKIILWGCVYEDINKNPSSNTRVAIRSCKLWVKWSSTWYQQQAFDHVSGANYWEDFRNNDAPKNDKRDEGSYDSVRAGSKSTAGVDRNYHFFAGSFKDINSGNNGVCGQAEFTLIKHNASGTDDRSSAKYYVNVGADYYNGGTWLGDVAIGRFLKAYTTWRRCYFYNMSEADFRANPPPL